MLVLMRLSLGCHFLYEGVWKIVNPEFSAEPFLTQAKGPAAKFFYAMLPDIDGRQRLRVDESGKKPVVAGEDFLAAWEAHRVSFIAYYNLNDEQIARTEQVRDNYYAALRNYLAENQADIIEYQKNLVTLDGRRSEPVAGAAFQEKRIWERQQELRGKVNGWLGAIEKMGKDFQTALFSELEPSQQAAGLMGSGWNPLEWDRLEQINFAVTYGLTAIGACLMLGLCTRLACLGGAAFMVFVLLTQPPWPTIYPPAPAVVGHSLVVNKDFIEMMALLTLATTAVGRWGGLDYFLYHWIGRPIRRFFGQPVA